MHAYDEQERPSLRKRKQFGSRQSLVRLLQRMEQSPRQGNLLSTSKDLDMLIAVQFGEDSPAVHSGWEHVAKNTVFLDRGRKHITNINQMMANMFIARWKMLYR